MKEKLIKTLNQYGQVGENKDGMDITVCRLNTLTNELSFSAANNNLYVVKTNSENSNQKDKIISKENLIKGE